MYNKSVFGIFFILIIFGSINSFGRIDDANLISIIQRDSILKSNRREVLNFFSYGENILKKYGAKAAVDSLIQFENTFDNSKDFGRKSFYYQVLMTFYSFLDYKKSLEYESIAYNKRGGAKHSLSTQAEFIDAKEYLVKKFSGEKIIMFNEAHNCSQNRSFVRDLLKDFHKKGFNYLAVEALSYSDSLLNKRKYPIQSSGLYINDPVFGQLIREALMLGIKVVPYEDTVFHKLDSYIVGANKREQIQAENIAKLLENDSSAKVVIYAGHDHIYKSSTGGITHMGERLSKITGLTIPSIDCTLMREGFTQKQENPNFIEALNRFSNATKPFIVIDSGQVFVDTKLIKLVDVNVFFPRTEQSLGYPNWAFKSMKKQSKFCISADNDNSFFVVYDKKEYNEVKTRAIPIFQSKLKKTNRICLPIKKSKNMVLFK